jgi:hypothetical protein
MTTPVAAIAVMPNVADLEALDAVLADFNLEEGTNAEDDVILDPTPEDEAELEAAEAAPAIVSDDALADLDLALAKSELYGEQKSASVTTTELPKPTDAVLPKGQRAKKAAGSAGASAARTPRDISKVANEFFVLAGDVSAMSEDDLKAARDATMKLVPNQVKVAEKFENLFTALSVGKAPSTYVMIAFKLLDGKGSMTSSDVVGAYKASGLGEGTARSQSGQIMNLFATVKIADRAGQTLTLRSDSLLAERLRSLPAPAAS